MTGIEFARAVALADIGDGIERAIAATAAERDALARRFDLRALDSLQARFALTPVAAGIRVSGRVTASVVQACVVSGEDVPALVDEPVELMLLRDTGAGEEIELAAADCDVLPLEDRAIEIGEIAAQTLGLALDPYPRAAPDALAEARRHLTSEEAAKAAASPFAVLRPPVGRR
jgi:uncharacterized metal-binding protein YceD (DUF177 family)